MILLVSQDVADELVGGEVRGVVVGELDQAPRHAALGEHASDLRLEVADVDAVVDEHEEPPDLEAGG